MHICYALNRDLSKRAHLFILLILLVIVTGCTKPDEEAATLAGQAQAYLAQNRIAEARLTIKKAILVKDDVSEYHIIRGRIEYAADSFENAFSAYSEALALDAANQEALQAVSQIGLRIGRLDESIDATDKLLVLNTNQKDALLTRGLHLLIKRKYAEAIASADKILIANPNDEGGVVLKARASFLSGSPGDATQILDNYEASKPNTAAVSLTRLEIYRELRDAGQMDRQFIDLRRLLPDDLSMRLDEANFRYKTGNETKGTAIVTSVLADKKASLETISSAIELWREYSVDRLNSELVGAVVRTGKPVARIAAARYLAGAGDINAAALLVADLTGPDADAERANLAFLKGDKTAADSISKAILELDKTHCAALGTQAALLFEAGKNNAALRSSQRAASECPHQSGLWVLAARIYSKLGDPANARRTFRQGIDANKQSEPLTRAFVEWLLSKNNEREAVAAARRITRSAPALISGWRLYSETCIRTRSDCVAEAKRGMFDATTRYGIDLLPGELPPNGLFGRFVIR